MSVIVTRRVLRPERRRLAGSRAMLLKGRALFRAGQTNQSAMLTNTYK
jgi:hypothetical protein